jgi:HPt (histidine-containing phosphotransfer) domain-containing protein
MDTLDLGQIDRLGGLGRAEIREILEVFLDDLPAQVEILAGQLETGDRESFRAGVHRLKGSALMCGFAAIGRQAGDWEKLCDTADPLPDPQDLRKILTTAGADARAAIDAASAGA